VHGNSSAVQVLEELTKYVYMRAESFLVADFLGFYGTGSFTTVLVNDQIDALLQCIYLFHFSTCFEQPSAHHKGNQLYQYIIWYVSLCVGD